MKWFIPLLLLSTILLIGCNAQQQEDNTEDNVMKIGAIVPLTGDYATLGNRIRNGMELAKSHIDEEDITIKIYYEDVCLSKDAISAVKKLTDIDKVSLIGGSFCVIGLIPNIPILEEKKIIAFNTAINPDAMLNHPYVFSTNKAIKDDAYELAVFAKEELNTETAAVIYYDTPLGRDYGKYFGEKYQELGGDILSDQAYELSRNDFRAELTKIKGENPDVVFIIGLSGAMGNLLKQAKELELDAKMLSFSEAEDPNVLTAAGSAAEGMIISSSESTVETDEMKAFQEEYEAQFGDAPDMLAANAYDALNLQVLVYQKCNGETECMVAELHNIKDYPGVSGTITIQEDGSSKKSNLFKVVKDGEFVLFEA